MGRQTHPWESRAQDEVHRCARCDDPRWEHPGMAHLSPRAARLRRLEVAEARLATATSPEAHREPFGTGRMIDEVAGVVRELIRELREMS